MVVPCPGEAGRSASAPAVLAGALLVSGGAAQAKTTTYVDLEAGIGFSTNPLLRLDSPSSAFGRVSAYGLHSWGSERGDDDADRLCREYQLSARLRFEADISARRPSSQSVSPTVTVFGDLGFDGDFAGQLSNRLFAVPSQPVVVEPGTPAPPVVNPLPPVNFNPDVFGFSGRQYRLNGFVGASIRSGTRATISLSAGAQRTWFTGGNSDADYNSYFASAGYSRQISERTSGGVSLSVQHRTSATAIRRTSSTRHSFCTASSAKPSMSMPQSAFSPSSNGRTAIPTIASRRLSPVRFAAMARTAAGAPTFRGTRSRR